MHSPYLDNIMQPAARKRAVKRVSEVISGIKCDAIAASGLSGVIIAALVAEKLKKTLVIVRKKNEDHHGNSIETTSVTDAFNRFVILDDFIMTGTTVNWIRDIIKTHYGSGPKCVAIVLHSGYEQDPHDGIRVYVAR